MAGWVSIFQDVEKNSMSEEALEEYVLDFSEAAYQDSGKHVPMVMLLTGWISWIINTLHLSDRLAQIIPTGRPQPFTLVWLKIP